MVAGGVGQAKQLRQGSLTAPHNVVEAFDPATRRWSRRTPMPVPVCAAASAPTATSCTLPVVRWRSGSRRADTPDLRRARTRGVGEPLPMPTWGASATVINGRLVVAGGWLADGGAHTGESFMLDLQPQRRRLAQMPPLNDPVSMYTPPAHDDPRPPYNRLVRAELDRAAQDAAANEPRPAPAPGLFHVTTLPWLLDEGRHPQRIFRIGFPARRGRGRVELC